MSKLFVGNLSFKVTDADLQNWFESNGYPVESAEVMTDHKTGRSRGIGFVVLKRNDQLKDAIAKLNGQSFNDRTVNVEEAKSPASNEGTRSPAAGSSNRCCTMSVRAIRLSSQPPHSRSWALRFSPAGCRRAAPPASTPSKFCVRTSRGARNSHVDDTRANSLE